MEIWPIDFDKTLKEISEWHNQWKIERFGSDSLNPERYTRVVDEQKKAAMAELSKMMEG